MMRNGKALDISVSVKPVRMTKGRDRVWMQFMGTITAAWARAVREQRPSQATHKELSDAINALDIAASYKADLHSRNWGARNVVEALHAEWCLYLDGKRTTSAECFALGRTNDLCGRFEWRGTGRPFYDDKEPALCQKPPHRTSRRYDNDESTSEGRIR